MKKSPADRFLRIPVRYIEGRWECEYGGVVPVGHDTSADLVISSKSITDKVFLKRMRVKSSIKVLDQNVKLLAYLATKEQALLTSEQRKHLIPFQSMTIIPVQKTLNAVSNNFVGKVG